MVKTSTMIIMATTTASLSLEALRSTVSPGDLIELDINIFTDEHPVISTDVWIKYDKEKVQPLLPAKNTSLFESMEAKIIEPGTLYIYGLHRDTLVLQPANGTMAKIQFKSLKSGAATFSFECQPTSATTSQIIKNDPSLPNIINCERTLSHAQIVKIDNAQVLGATDRSFPSLTMWYLTIIAALLTITTILYIRTKKLAKEET